MSTPVTDLELIQRLILAAALGAVLGFERELRHKNAGLRTNILIAMGSALFTLMSIEISEARGTDPGRIAAQIVTGIGFLGAGAIMRTGGGVQGLTTAATVWVNAAVGVAVGGGEYHLALMATSVTVIVLLVLVPIERVIERFSARRGLADPQFHLSPPDPDRRD
jgi:putative Mg2+ transporter-C (MgtC) family protein